MVCLFNKVNAQSEGMNIQYITFKDSILIRNIVAVINQEKQSNDRYQFFNKGLGYISVKVRDYNHGDTALVYHITPALVAIKENDPDIVYPPYYTLVAGHPVLIFIRSVTLITNLKYSAASKDSLRKFLEPFLLKPKNADFYNEKGEKIFSDKNFRPDFLKFESEKDYYLIHHSY